MIEALRAGDSPSSPPLPSVRGENIEWGCRGCLSKWFSKCNGLPASARAASGHGRKAASRVLGKPPLGRVSCRAFLLTWPRVGSSSRTGEARTASAISTACGREKRLAASRTAEKRFLLSKRERRRPRRGNGGGRRGVSAPQPRRRPPPRPPAGAAHCARQHGAGVGVRGLKAVRPSRVPLWWWLGGAVRVLHAWTAEGEGVLQQLSLQLSFTPLLSRGQLQNRFGARRSTDGGTKEMTCRWQ